MAVTLTVSKTLGGAAVNDTLAGASTGGIDLGSAVNAEWCPIISKSANTGWQSVYLSHNATIDPITDVRTFIGQYTGTYGGATTAAGDYTTIKAKGAASSNAANNSDGLGGGLRVEHDADIAGTLGLSAFDGTRPQVRIYGKDYGSGQAGVTLATAFPLHVDACLRNNAGTAVDATTPVTGKIGKAGDTVLGDTALMKLRYYLEDAAPNGGIIQWDWVVGFSFTA